MRQVHLMRVVIILAVLSLAACATRPAPDFGGRWKPVNRFAATTTEIPLHGTYVFQASPMDGTLKAMLERWATDSGMALDYQLGSDFTLHQAVASIATPDAQLAVEGISSAFATQGIRVSIDGNRIVAQAVGAAGVSDVGTGG